VPNAVSFQVLVSTNPNGPFVPANLLSLTPNGATVGGLTPGVTYYFRVHSVDASGVASPVSNTIAVTAGSAAGGTLVPPTGLTVFNVTPTTATLAWSPVAGAQGYIVLQATTPGGPFVPSAVINMTSNGATVVGLAHGTTYFFEVRAIDTVGFQTAPSNLASATTLI
jgi:chitodextrinase